MKAIINHQPVSYQIEGESSPPDNRVLLATSIDLTAGTAWASAGYTVADFLPANAQQQLVDGLAELVREALRETGLPVAADFPVSDYHKLIGDDTNRHLAVINITKQYPQDRLPVPAALLEARVSALCGRPVHSLNPYDNARIFHLRIVRPGRSDNNPLHRDVWLPNYDNCINIYVPVAGSTPNSSLTLIPGSHWWPESQTERTLGGALYNGAAYNVPGVKETTEVLELIRPNPDFAEVLLFSPYLLHGGAINLNQDATRISLEMRFWQA
ncbi:hypothetical protein J0X19_13310 [Hymenobacter sp. BT186]|uniref:Phytanoyl-CoA dioxygenase n=1 Tax=Hymenobacter telluris TaxID=2816474 RepID=A0A939JD17_9BACT|nr:hypothetical protein [Hymenobacter telluris]MBO0358930.1 hypothetical protein [Hymenobacter telluris]MBW3374956.1 phytanoyl-CoA dioxygenase family protein [Hymenobacter norwichensis]